MKLDNKRYNGEDSIFYSSLFTHSVFKRLSPKSVKMCNGAIVVGVNAPMIQPSQHLVMVGGAVQLGNWSINKGVKMADGEFPLWKSSPLKLTDDLQNCEFKFVVVDTESGEVVAWEEGYNRKLYIDKSTCYLTLEPAKFVLSEWRGAGVAIPVFSLRSEQSMGVGEFLDLKKMVDWAAITGQRIIQILPINDTTMTGGWEDSYPYNANSIFALHPLYISLLAIGKLRDKKLQEELITEGCRLNALEVVDYEAVNQLKHRYLRQLYSEIGVKVMLQKGFNKFFKENKYWLESYALFSLLRDKYSTVDFSKWGDEAVYNDVLLSKYRKNSSKKLAYYYFVQYNLHLQLIETREYATSKGVAFKGDIPIGVSRTSADVWVNPRLFCLNSQAGAPPDAFSRFGQNWGFPTYNWDEMAKDNYAWWSARFTKMAEYFDAYRIDHILGFFRIWEIPLDTVHGLLGHFSPALPYSVDEMRDSYGFYFEKSYAEPSINDWLLGEFFGVRAHEVADRYFNRGDNGALYFKSEYNSQQKVAQSVEDRSMCDGLLGLFNEVLFVEDPYHKGCYHPRISAQHTYKYSAMNEWDRHRYNKLYDDFFYYRHNDFWRERAMQRLPSLISATNMLTCGEDLGMIPNCVPQVMAELKILSLEIQRMPKDSCLEFGEPWHYPYSSVCTTSTHDMNPVRAWLLENRDISRNYLSKMFGIDYNIEGDCPGWICEKIIQQHLSSPAIWSILPFQDWLSMFDTRRNPDPNAERINVPANSRHYWRYRMHCTLEELLEMCDVNTKIEEMIKGLR